MLDEIRKKIKFGTDGWRAVISDTFTYENVSIVAQAISVWVKKDIKVKKGKRKSVAVGYDTRFLSKEYAQLMSCVLAKNNIDVFLSDRAIPTPSLSYGVIERKCNAGVMITASHNPPQFNGIKIKTSLGGGAGLHITKKVEDYLGLTTVKTMDLDEALKLKKICLMTILRKLLYVPFILTLKKNLILVMKFIFKQDLMVLLKNWMRWMRKENL